MKNNNGAFIRILGKYWFNSRGCTWLADSCCSAAMMLPQERKNESGRESVYSRSNRTLLSPVLDNLEQNYYEDVYYSVL